MLTFAGLTKRFGENIAVRELSLEIMPGEVFGLLGPNGAGKTTTIQMATGRLAPDAGSVDVRGLGAPTRTEVRAALGVAPQELALYDHLTGRENLAFFGRLYGLRGAALRNRVDELLERTGLADRAGDRAKTYSGGMKRRLNFAAALLHEPSVVLLDEPTAGVDPQSRLHIFELVAEQKAAGRTVVYTTHYMEEAQRLCDRVAIMDHGRLLALDTVSALVAGHGGQSVVRIETADGEVRVETDDAAAAVAAQLKQHPDAHGIHVDRPDLETVFLALTGRSLRD